MRILVAALVLATTTVGAQGRLGAPSFVTCDRNDLTAYSGRVKSLQRGEAETRISIATDWSTQEQVVIRHPDGDLLSTFHRRGKPFTESDLAVLMPAGRLKPDTRATAWVCEKGMRPQIDWDF